MKDLKYMVGTMIEIPRAALTADEVAKEAEFFSFGTNDLTQTTMGLSRDDYTKFQKEYEDKKIFANDPFAVLDQEGVGQAGEDGGGDRPQDATRTWKSASAASTAASRARCSSAIAWAWTTFPALRTACRSPAWPRRRRRSRGDKSEAHAHRVVTRLNLQHWAGAQAPALFFGEKATQGAKLAKVNPCFLASLRLCVRH